MTLTPLARLECATGVVSLVNYDGALLLSAFRIANEGFNWPLTEKFGWDLIHATRQAKSGDRVRVDSEVTDDQQGFLAGLNVFLVLRGHTLDVDFLYTPFDNDGLYVNLVVPQEKWQEFVDVIKDAILTHYPRAVVPPDFSLV